MPETPGAPPEPTETEFRFTTAQVNQADVRKQAYDVADETLQQEQHDMLNRTGSGRLRGRLQNVWRQTFTRTARRQAHMREAEQAMITNQNMHDPQNADRTAHQRDMNAIVGRVTEGFLRVEEGEEQHEGVAPEVETRVKAYIEHHVNNADAAQLQTDLDAIQEAIHAAHSDTIAGFSIEEIQALAANIKEKESAERTLESMLNEIKFYEAEVRSGVRTELQRTQVEQALEWIERRRGLVVSAKVATFAVTAAVAAGVGLKSAAGRIASTIVPGAVGAAIAGVHEARTLKSERAHLERSSAKGESIAGPDQKRRQELAESIYEKASAARLIQQLEALMPENGSPDDLSPADVRTLNSIVQEIQAREVFGIQDGIDLISFSGSENVETERFNLVRLRAQGERYVSERMGTFEAGEQPTMEMYSLGTITDEIEAKDEAYRQLRKRRVGRAMIQGALVGLVVGTTIQEASAGIRSDYQGVADGLAVGGPAGASDRTWLRNVLAGSGIWDGSETHTITTPGASGSDHQPIFGPGPDGSEPVQVTHPNGPNQVAIDRSDPDWNYHEYNGGKHYERIHEGYLTSISNGFRLVHEIHDQNSNAGYITLQDVYGNVVADRLAQGPGGLTPDSLQKLHDLGITTEFDPTGDDGKGRLDIVIPEKSTGGTETHTKEIHSPTGVEPFTPPIVAPFLTGRRELEVKPGGTAPTPGPGPGPTPTPEPSPAPSPGPGTGTETNRRTEEFRQSVAERVNNSRETWDGVRGRFNNINDRATFNEVVADLYNNGYIDMEEGDNPDLGDNNVRLKLKDDAPEEYKDIFEKLVEAQRRIENAELDSGRYFESVRQRVNAGLDRAGLNQVLSDLDSQGIIDLHEGINPDLGDNNVRFSLKPDADPRYQEIVGVLQEQQRKIEDAEQDIPIDFEQNFEAQHSDGSETLDNLVYDRYANVFGVTSTFGREDLRETAAKSARDTFISNLRKFGNRQAFETMSYDLEQQLRDLRSENGNLMGHEDLGINAAVVRLDRKTQKAEVLASGNMAVIYISPSGNAEYLTANQTQGGMEGRQDTKTLRSRTSMIRLVKEERAKKAGKTPEEQNQIELELQEELAKYHQIGSKKVEPGGRFVMVSRPTFADMGWDEDGMLEQVKQTVAGKSSTEATQAILGLFDQNDADKSALVVDVNERTEA